MGSIFRSASGAFVAQVNRGGKRRSRTFQTKTEAARWIRHEEVAVEQGKRSGNTAARFGDLLESYIAALEEDGAAVSSKRISAYRIIASHLARIPVADLDVQAFRRFAQERRATGAGPATIGGDLVAIGTILRVAGPAEGVLVENALAALTSARKAMSASGAVARPDERSRRPTDSELATLRDYWSKRRRGIPIWQIVCFAVCTAMRLAEICRIRWADLDHEAKTIVIRDRKHPRSKKGNDQAVPLLRGPVTIDGSVIDPLEIIQSMPRESAEIFPFDARTISTSFTRAVAACGIDDLHFHDLRHDGVSRLFEAGYSIEQVALVSGHRDWNMLRRYTQLDPASLHREA